MITKEAWEVAEDFMNNTDHCDCGNMNFDRDKLEELLKEYAKQQSIAFFEHLKKYASYGDNTPEQLYNQFIEQQNKEQ